MMRCLSNETPTEALLEIVIITYNRREKLKSTLKSLFADYSPVRNCQITILDNCSTDGASDICAEYGEKYKNVRHIRHHQNIGGNANICRAYEVTQKEYVWCLADDDTFQWSNWAEIENAMQENFDCIFTTLVNLRRARGVGGVLMESTFCPACIYKKSNIDSDVIQGMYSNIYNFLPHVTIAASLIMKNKRIFTPTYEIVIQAKKYEDIPEIATMDINRGNQVSYSKLTENKFWEVGFINIVSILPEKLQNAVYADLSQLYQTKEQFVLYLVKYFVAKGASTKNLFDLYASLSPEYQDEFIKTLFKYYEVEQFEKIIFCQNDWNLLFISQLAKKKSGRIKSIVKRILKKILLFGLRQIH